MNINPDIVSIAVCDDQKEIVDILGHHILSLT